MTPDQLDAVIRSGDAEACLTLLASASEAERRAAANLAISWRKDVCARLMAEITDQQAQSPDLLDLRRLDEVTGICLLGTASLSVLKELGWRSSCLPDHAYEVLRDRRPAWLGDWAAWTLEDESWDWPLVRRLVREGLCPRPPSDQYVLGMLDHRRTSQPVQERLLANPDLLGDEVWRLFEVEGSGENSLAAQDKYAGRRQTWSSALISLAAERRLSRERLLDSSLDALQRDFAPFRAGWFSRFHEALSPTVDERAARTDRYLSLLGSRAPATVSFALKALALLEKQSCLDGSALLDHVAPALSARARGTVTTALALIDRAARRTPELKGSAAAVAVAALIQEAPEVQAAALDVIERHGDRTSEELSRALHARLDSLAASQRPRLEAWSGPCGSPSQDEAPNVPDEAEALLQRAERLPPDLAALAGVDVAVRAVRHGTLEVPALELPLEAVPRLDPAALLAPVRSLDELLDLFAAVLENNGPPDDIERVLDGVSRLCADLPPDFDRRVGPLTRRAVTLLERSSNLYEDPGPRRDLCVLALAWIAGESPEIDPAQPSLAAFLSARTMSVACRAAARQPSPLLATPTHYGGWIDPRVFVARALALQSGAAVFILDLLQALLRLALDHRAEALQMAQECVGEVGDAVRYALGAGSVTIGPTAPLWVAAARARAPFVDDLRVEARHPDLGPDAGRAARVQFSGGSCKSGEYLHLNSILDRQPAVPDQVGIELPTVLHHIAVEREEAATRRWAATMWPLARERWSALGFQVIAYNLDWWEAQWGNRFYLEALLDPDTSLGPMARLLLCVALAAKEPGESGLATDALIMAIDDGRLDSVLLGETLATLLPSGLARPGRWAKTLGEASRTSPLHATVIRTGLELALHGEPAQRPGDLVALLDLLHELCLQTGGAIAAPEGREYLGRFTGGGKAAQLARTLLALESAGDESHRRSAAIRALSGRIERAEHWHQRSPAYSRSDRSCSSIQRTSSSSTSSRTSSSPRRASG